VIHPLSISQLIFDTVPQLYEANAGKYPVDLRMAGESSRVYSLVPLTPALQDYLQQAEATWEELRPMTEGEISQIIEREWIQQKFVISWLERRTKVRAWGAVLDYVRRLSRRLTENNAMSKTLVILPDSAQVGNRNPNASRISDPAYFKVLDWLGNSPYTYFQVTEDLRILSFSAIGSNSPSSRKASEIPASFRFYPDFLHPVISNLPHPDAVVVHLAVNGSILVADQEGMIASKRSLESWTVFDIDHVLESMATILNRQIQESGCTTRPSFVACSLFQILFDISLKRHGGLLILDQRENLSRYVVKGIDRDSESPLMTLFTEKAFNGVDYSSADVRKLVELSSIDGALILDLYGNLLQIGSMIVSHPSTPNRFGMREAAAYSAAAHGATALKISADGHMSVFFTTPDCTFDQVHQFHFR